MNIAIIDADLMYNKSQRFPNLACMKISAFEKSKGNTTELITEYSQLFKSIDVYNRYKSLKESESSSNKIKKSLFRIQTSFDIIKQSDVLKFDFIYISKVFTETVIDDNLLKLPNVKYGGTGFYYDKAEPLPYEVEHIMPDYHLYDTWVQSQLDNHIGKRSDYQYYLDYSIGFTTRGCIRQCSFCVNKNYKRCNQHSPVSEFLDESRPYICLLDDNVLSCPQWKSIFEELQSTDKPFQYKQGMDERLLTAEKCEMIFTKSKWKDKKIFAFDNIKDYDLIESKLKLIRQYTDEEIKFYCFCGFNHNNPDNYDNDFWKQDIVDLFKRIELLMKYGCHPYIMRYKDYKLSPYYGTYINVATWCNMPSLFTKLTYTEFVNKCVERSSENSSYKRYYDEYLQANPNILHYYNMRYHKWHNEAVNNDIVKT